jgi:hypothetical protein
VPYFGAAKTDTLTRRGQLRIVDGQPPSGLHDADSAVVVSGLGVDVGVAERRAEVADAPSAGVSASLFAGRTATIGPSTLTYLHGGFLV